MPEYFCQTNCWLMVRTHTFPIQLLLEDTTQIDAEKFQLKSGKLKHYIVKRVLELLKKQWLDWLILHYLEKTKLFLSDWRGEKPEA